MRQGGRGLQNGGGPSRGAGRARSVRACGCVCACVKKNNEIHDQTTARDRTLTKTPRGELCGWPSRSVAVAEARGPQDPPRPPGPRGLAQPLRAEDPRPPRPGGGRGRRVTGGSTGHEAYEATSHPTATGLLGQRTSPSASTHGHPRSLLTRTRARGSAASSRARGSATRWALGVPAARTRATGVDN